MGDCFVPIKIFPLLLAFRIVPVQQTTMLEGKTSHPLQIFLPLPTNPPILTHVELLKLYQLLAVLGLLPLMVDHILIFILLYVQRTDECYILIEHLGTN